MNYQPIWEVCLCVCVGGGAEDTVVQRGSAQVRLTIDNTQH